MSLGSKRQEAASRVEMNYQAPVSWGKSLRVSGPQFFFSIYWEHEYLPHKVVTGLDEIAFIKFQRTLHQRRGDTQ